MTKHRISGSSEHFIIFGGQFLFHLSLKVNIGVNIYKDLPKQSASEDGKSFRCTRARLNVDCK